MYLWFRWAALFCLWIAFINVGSVFGFDVFLSAIRLKPPRILRDLLVALAYVVLGMMTGEQRSATVIAVTNVECYRLVKEAFHEVLKQRPEIADDISMLLANRRVELEAAREGLNEEAKRLRMRYHQNDLLRRIKNFFTL